MEKSKKKANGMLKYRLSQNIVFFKKYCRLRLIFLNNDILSSILEMFRNRNHPIVEEIKERA
jgi:hypothetical protein